MKTIISLNNLLIFALILISKENYNDSRHFGYAIQDNDITSIKAFLNNPDITPEDLGYALWDGTKGPFDPYKGINLIINHPKFQEVPIHFIEFALGDIAKNGHQESFKMLMGNKRSSEISPNILQNSFVSAATYGYTDILDIMMKDKTIFNIIKKDKKILELAYTNLLNSEDYFKKCQEFAEQFIKDNNYIYKNDIEKSKEISDRRKEIHNKSLSYYAKQPNILNSLKTLIKVNPKTILKKL